MPSPRDRCWRGATCCLVPWPNAQYNKAKKSETGDSERAAKLDEREKKLDEKEKLLEAQLKEVEELGDKASSSSPDQASLLEQEKLLTEWEKDLGEKEKQIDVDKEIQAELLLELDEKRSELDEREAQIAEREKAAGKPKDSEAAEGEGGEELKREMEEQTEVLQQLLQELEEKQESIDTKTSELEAREALLSEREKELEKREESTPADDDKDADTADFQKKIDEQAAELKKVQEELASQQKSSEEKMKEKDASITKLQDEIRQLKMGGSMSAMGASTSSIAGHVVCKICGVEKEKAAFSKSQLKNKSNKCKDCVSQSEGG